MRKLRKCCSLFLILVIALGVLAGCASTPGKDFQEMADFEQAKVGVLTGSSFDLLAKEYLPEAEKLYYMNITDLILNLKQEKIDGILMDEAFFVPLLWESEETSFIEMDMPVTEYAVAFPKTAESELLKAQIDEFIQEFTKNGWLDELTQKWFSGIEPDNSIDLSQLTGENGTLRVATTVESKPFNYLRDGRLCGLSTEFIFRFAKEYGYALEVDTMDFGALLPSLSAGRYDLAISSITVTEERKESVLFSDAYCRSPIVMAILGEHSASEREKTLADYAHAKIGIMTGSSHDGTAKELFPEAERMYFNTVGEEILAVEQGKIDCYIEDEHFMIAAIWENAEVMRLAEPVKQVQNGFVFPQSEESRQLREEINAFIAASIADGTIDRLKEKWISDAEPTEHPDYTTLTGENGTINLAVVVESKPMIYLKDGLCTGFEIELLTLFARQHGYAFNIEDVPFTSVIAGMAAGKYDMAASALNITPEREESVDFSDPYATFDVVMVVKDDSGKRTEKTLDDFKKATIGVMTGTIYETIAKERFPNAKRENYTLLPDLIAAVTQGKVDGYLSESTYVTAAIWEGAEVVALDETIAQSEAGYIFQKGEASARLREQLNTFIRAAKEDGTLDVLWKKWMAKTEPTEVLDYDSLTGENGTLKVAVAPDLKPISYVKNGKLTGYEIEILVLFAREYGYKLDIAYMTFDAILPGVTTGKYDIGTGAVTITEERAQSLDFSESHMTVDVVMVVKAEDEPAGNNFWTEIREDFEKTFIRENRWKLIVKGIGVTVLISISAAIAGTLLGFGLYMLSRSDTKLLQMLAKGIAKVYSRIVAGTPVVVILMILFYVIFGKFRDMSGIAVAIIGFTLTFGAFVYDHMTVSVGSVDRGQTEAAYALGYTKNQTFFRIIFPQAMNIFLPSYCGQAVELIKATAVVGYVAVNDLTKMGDIIRSNTYEAFFPLIATAVIYFLLTWILSVLLRLVKVRFEPKRRSREDILKGVKTV